MWGCERGKLAFILGGGGVMQERMSCLVVDLGSRDRGASFGRMEGGAS